MGDREKRLVEVKDLIRSVLISNKGAVGARQFMEDYTLFNGHLDYRGLGFKSVDALLRSMPDVVRIKSNFKGEIEYHGVANENTAHIQKMVQAQKSGKKKKKLIRPNPKKMQTYPGRGWPVEGRHWPSHNAKPPLFSKKPPNWRPPSNRGGGARGGFYGRPPQRGRGSDRADSASPPFSSAQEFKKSAPPRFQKQRPVAVVTPSSSSTHSPSRGSSPHHGMGEKLSPQALQQVKGRVQKLLETHPNGVWITRLPHMYEDKFLTAPPSNLAQMVQEWRDFIQVEESQSHSPILFAKNIRESRSPSTSSSSSSSSSTTVSRPSKTLSQSSPIPVPLAPWTAWKDVKVTKCRLPELGVKTEVVTCFIVSLSDFYVHPAGFDSTSMSSLLQKTAMNCPPPKVSDLWRNMFCSACFSVDQEWYRAFITDLPYKEAKVRFIDFGNTEQMPYGRLRPLPPEAASHPPAQAIHCCLARVVPRNDDWSKEAVQFFARTVQEQELVMVVQEYGNDETAYVDLYVEKNCLNDQLVSRGYADYAEEEDDYEPPPLMFPEDRFIPVYVCCLNPVEKVLYVRLVGEEYSDQLDKLSGTLEENYNSRPPMALEELEVSMVCIMKEDSEDTDSCNYHRCRVISKEDDGMVLCTLLDHGVCDLVHPSNLRFLEAEVNKTLAYQAKPCVLYGVDVNDATISTINDMVVGKSFIGDNAGLEGQDESEPLCLVLYDTDGSELSINDRIKRLMSSAHTTPDRSACASPDLANLKITVNMDDQSRQISDQSPPAAGVSKPIYSWSSDQLPRNDETSSTISSAAATTSTAPATAATATTGTAAGDNATTTTGAAVSRPTGATGGGDAGTLRPETTRAKQWNPAYYFKRPMPARRQLPSSSNGQVGELSVDVVVIRSDDPSNFVVIQCEDTKFQDEMMVDLQEVFSNPETKVIHLDEEDVRAGVLYGVLVDGIWYRAIVEKVESLGISVYLCDYGEYHLVSIDALRPLPNKFWRPEQFAIKCRLHDVQPIRGQVWAKEARDAFHHLAHDGVVYAIRITEIPDPERNIVSLINTSEDEDVVIADRLLQLGYARQPSQDQQ